VMGTPFCGSTIFGAALGMHGSVFDAGELLYWTYKIKRAGPCSCRKPTETCEFWSEVGARLASRGVDLPRYKALQHRLEFVRINGAGGLLQRRTGPAADEYAATTLAILDTVGKVSGGPIIVDTSKHPARGAALAGIPALDVRFVHLVRDARSFVVSRMKRLKKGDPMSRAYIARQLLIWSTTNLGIEYVCRSTRRPYARLNYEDFLDSPHDSLARIGKVTQLDLSQVAEAIEEGTLIEFGHAVSGNALRVSGPTALRREERGPEAFPPARDWLYAVLAGPLAFRYGYRGRVLSNPPERGF